MEPRNFDINIPDMTNFEIKGKAKGVQIGRLNLKIRQRNIPLDDRKLKLVGVKTFHYIS